MTLKPLSPLEEKVMIHIWNNGLGDSIKATIAEMPEPRMKPEAFSITLNRLAKKSYLRSLKNISPNLRGYSLAMPEDYYKRELLGRMVMPHYQRSYMHLLDFLIEKKKLVANDLLQALAKLQVPEPEM
jgi:predicted transcriptional regulator